MGFKNHFSTFHFSNSPFFLRFFAGLFLLNFHKPPYFLCFLGIQFPIFFFRFLAPSIFRIFNPKETKSLLCVYDDFIALLGASIGNNSMPITKGGGFADVEYSHNACQSILYSRKPFLFSYLFSSVAVHLF